MEKFSNLMLQNFIGGSFKGQQCYLFRPPRIQEGKIEKIGLKKNGTLVITSLIGKKFTTTLGDYKLIGLKSSKNSILLEAFQKGRFLILSFPSPQATA